MNSDSDLLLGIDVGMSCTGVAYINKARGSTSPKVLQSWPGAGKDVEAKVPTVVVYDKNNPMGPPTSWGFGSEVESERGADRYVKQWFKVDFPKGGEPHRWYVDYLRQLYNHLQSEFQPQVLNGKQWQQAKVEFIFSVPATWGTDDVQKFKEAIGAAGFGTVPGHKLKVDLTEPQAVAVHAVIEESATFNDGDSVLVVDVGGGTADIAVVKIQSRAEGYISLAEFQPVSGDNVGSTYIDHDFEQLVCQHLEPISQYLSKSREDVAWDMMMSRDFQNSKLGYGRVDYRDDEVFRIRVPGLHESINMPQVGVGRGQMAFAWRELRQLFDTQIGELKTGINTVLDDMDLNSNLRHTKINHIIMSGGLGNSRYVQDQIKNYITSISPQYPMIDNVHFHVSTEPQLAVCRGLLLNKTNNVLKVRCCRYNYGILCSYDYKKRKEEHNNAKSEGRVTIDPMTGKELINDCCDWFIYRGGSIHEGIPNRHIYKTEFPLGTIPASRLRDIIIITSNMNKPPVYRDAGVRIETMLKCDFSGLQGSDVEEKKRGCFGRLFGKKDYLRCRFFITAEIGAAEVDFYACSRDGRIRLSKPNRIQLTFEEIPAQGDKTVLVSKG